MLSYKSSDMKNIAVSHFPHLSLVFRVPGCEIWNVFSTQRDTL